MAYDIKKQCHVCHGHGVKVDKDLNKVQCKRCGGTGLPSPAKQRLQKRPPRQSYNKNAGMEELKKVKPV